MNIEKYTVYTFHLLDAVSQSTLKQSWGRTCFVWPQWDFWPLTLAVLLQRQPLSYARAPRGLSCVSPSITPPGFCIFQFCVALDASVDSLGASALSLESTFSCVGSVTSFLWGNNQARAAAAVPSPLWREKHRNVAQTKAQQPVKVVRRYRGTKAKFRNWGRQTEIIRLFFFYTGMNNSGFIIWILVSKKEILCCKISYSNSVSLSRKKCWWNLNYEAPTLSVFAILDLSQLLWLGRFQYHTSH